MTYARVRVSETEGTLAVDSRTTTMLKKVTVVEKVHVASSVVLLGNGEFFYLS